MNEFEIRDKLKTDRKEIKSFDDLVNFLKEAREYNVDYGGAPRAIAQAALATAWWFASDFGITGFQAGCVMWDFIIDWMYTSNQCGLRIVDYDDMLYPQYIDEVYVSRPCEDGKKVGMIRIRDIKYIEPVELRCKHYIPNTGVNIR